MDGVCWCGEGVSVWVVDVGFSGWGVLGIGVLGSFGRLSRCPVARSPRYQCCRGVFGRDL